MATGIVGPWIKVAVECPVMSNLAYMAIHISSRGTTSPFPHLIEDARLHLRKRIPESGPACVEHTTNVYVRDHVHSYAGHQEPLCRLRNLDSLSSLEM